MENDVLKNKIAPWQEKGRWYHGTVNVTNDTDISFIDELTDSFLLDTDKFNVAFANTGRLYLYSKKSNIRILDTRIIIWPNFLVKSSAYFVPAIYLNPDGTSGVLVALHGSGNVDFWVFIIEENV